MSRAPGRKKPVPAVTSLARRGSAVPSSLLTESGIRVAEYMTDLPPRHVLERKLHEAIRVARQRLESGGASATRRQSLQVAAGAGRRKSKRPLTPKKRTPKKGRGKKA